LGCGSGPAIYSRDSGHTTDVSFFHLKNEINQPRPHYSLQDVDCVPQLFGDTVAEPRCRYREYVRVRIELGRCPELVGGGLLRSSGGWGGLKR
jgi:hypothetical protein